MANWKQVRDQRRTAYIEKLRDPRWQKKRLDIFSRDEWTCQICFSKENTLNVHHRYYLTSREPWEYPDEALVTLCQECHETESEAIKEIDDDFTLILKQAGFFAMDMKAIAAGFVGINLQHLPEVVATAIGWAVADEETQRLIVDRFMAQLPQPEDVPVETTI